MPNLYRNHLNSLSVLRREHEQRQQQVGGQQQQQDGGQRTKYEDDLAGILKRGF
jgi:hypothetical protein